MQIKANKYPLPVLFWADSSTASISIRMGSCWRFGSYISRPRTRWPTQLNRRVHEIVVLQSRTLVNWHRIIGVIRVFCRQHTWNRTWTVSEGGTTGWCSITGPSLTERSPIWSFVSIWLLISWYKRRNFSFLNLIPYEGVSLRWHNAFRRAKKKKGRTCGWSTTGALTDKPCKVTPREEGYRLADVLVRWNRRGNLLPLRMMTNVGQGNFDLPLFP